MQAMHPAQQCRAQRSFALLSAVLLAGSSLAQTTVYSEQDKLTRGSRDVATLGADLFGDQVSMYNGNIEFRQTDVSLPGNNALSVSVGRRLVPTEIRLAGLFDDWDLDIPHLHGVFKNTSGWVTNAGTQLRCSGYGPPDTGNFQGGTWDPNEYWHGSFIYLPGQGSQEILTRSGTNPNYPSDGNAWPLTTQSMVSIRCLSTMSLGAGEGFIAVTPDGTQYRFDWMVSRSYPYVSKPAPTSEGLTGGSLARGGTASRAAKVPPTTDVGSSYTLARKEVWILPTLVTDRHGNTVTYSYDPTKPWRLNSVTSSDGRSITLTYEGTSNRVSTVTDGTRTWTYTYSNGLNRITQTHSAVPGSSEWMFAMSGFTQTPPMYIGSPSCDNEGQLNTFVTSGSMTHPSGAVGTFNIAPTSHGRSFVERECRGDPSYGDYAVYPRYMASRSLQTKTISGPGLDSMTWAYTYSPSSATASWNTCSGTCPDYKTVDVVDPRNVLTRYTFGNRYRVTEGQLQKVEVGPVGGPVLRTTTMHYRDPAAGPYPSTPGISPQRRGNGELASRYAPQDQRVITQQGKTFTWQAAADYFDTKARARRVTRSSDLNPAYSRTETTTYRDIDSKWVLGLVESVTESSTGAVPVSNIYDLANGNLLSSFKFGKLQVSYTYYPSSSPPTPPGPNDGALWTAKDRLNHVTTYSNYKRGLAQNIAYADGKGASAVVNSIGLITSLTNEVLKTTNYGYDAMGRLASIGYPSEPLGPYNATTLTFEKVNALESGLPAGHWRQTITTGTGTVTNLFDGLWRKRVTYSAASGVVASAQLTHYDVDGRVRFQSYPLGAVPSITDAPNGSSATYDALGRVTLKTQDTELSPSLRSSSASYLAGFLTQSSDFNGNVSTSAFQAFDSPSEEALASLAGPEGLNLVINRDVFGKPLAITRYGATPDHGNGAGVYTSVTRSYVYDGYHLLCKTIEPELGATLQEWDAAGNLAWRTGGTGLTGNTCDRGSVSAAQQISFGYDARNRLISTSFGDGSPGISRTYTDDGLPYQIAADGSTWTYGYSNRRLLTSETLNFGGSNYSIVRGYNANAHLSELTYPDGTVVAHAPDALGRLTQVGSFATGITYKPNGAMQGYSYGNSVVHSLTQNLRGLPQVMTDAGRVSDQYAYDANGNVMAITDLQEGITSRSMGYDGLNRLTTASGSTWGTGSYAYDVQDNLRSSTVGARSATHAYDAYNRLASVSGTGVSLSYGYDANGNINSRSGQAFVFDLGNRIRSAPGKSSYAYDGEGRRTFISNSDGTSQLQVYDRAGLMLYATSVGGAPSTTKYIYLSGKLIAEVDSAAGTTYSHTDALGSPVARTNSSGGLINRTRFEPYGNVAAGFAPTRPNSIGFTGHVSDANTGLTYMQQRYYDPIAGRFLSVDPVVTDWESGGQFNRYVYAYNNPYGFIDPDGRIACNSGERNECEEQDREAIRRGFLPLDAGGSRSASPPSGAANAPGGPYLEISNGETATLGAVALGGVVLVGAAVAAPEVIIIVGSRLATRGLGGVGGAAKGEATVFRVFGGDTRANGFSWTTKDPRTVSNFRDAAGLPSGGPSGATNTADFLVKGKANAADIIKSRSALPLDGNKGGLPELIVDPRNVRITDFSVLKP